jgi:ABC-2 type transport system permease protein
LLGAFVPIARRSISRTLRAPVLTLPNFVFPLLLFAVLAKGASQVAKLPGFPTHSYTTFILGAILVHGATGAMTIAGDPLGRDLESGFLSRIALTPVQTWMMALGSLAGIIVISLVQAALYVAVGLAAGASIKTGVGGGVAVVAIALMIALAFGSLGLLAAVRTGSAQQVQSLAALGLALLFLSSMIVPRNLITAGWFKAIATYNPVSYMVEAPRSLIVSGWDAQALALGCGITLAIIAACLAITVVDLRSRAVLR